jgi:hypothetical protein
MSPSSSLTTEESHDASLLERLDMEVDAKFFAVCELAPTPVGYFNKTVMTKGQMPNPVVMPIVIIKQLAPLLP